MPAAVFSSSLRNKFDFIMSSSFQWTQWNEYLMDSLAVTMPYVTRRENEKKVGNVRPAMHYGQGGYI